jgi:hypothetical protein
VASAAATYATVTATSVARSDTRPYDEGDDELGEQGLDEPARAEDVGARLKRAQQQAAQ